MSNITTQDYETVTMSTEKNWCNITQNVMC
jgi:hypothetical protein